jgi:hypothetical protein
MNRRGTGVVLLIALGAAVSGCGSVSGKGQDAAVAEDAPVLPDDAAVSGVGGGGGAVISGVGGGGGGVAGASGSGGADGGAAGATGLQLVEGAIVSLDSPVSAGAVTLESDGFELVDQMCSTDGTVCMTGGGLTP